MSSPTRILVSTPGSAGPTATHRNGSTGFNCSAATTVRLGNGVDRGMTFGAHRSDVEGSPATPSLQLDYPGRWRFRWTVGVGIRTISVRVKQPANMAPYPSLVIKKNADVGLMADVVATSGGGTDWTTISGATFTASASGVVWVELWNNLRQTDPRTPCYFDHILVT